MTFSTEVSKPVNERYLLCSIEPARFIPDADKTDSSEFATTGTAYASAGGGYGSNKLSFSWVSTVASTQFGLMRVHLTDEYKSIVVKDGANVYYRFTYTGSSLATDCNHSSTTAGYFYNLSTAWKIETSSTIDGTYTLDSSSGAGFTANFPKQYWFYGTISVLPIETTTALNISKIEINGVEGTEKTSVAACTSDGDWYHDGTTLSVYMDTYTDYLIVYHKLYFTQDIGKYHYSDPEDTGTDVVYWTARIASDNSFKQTMKNYAGGLVTIGASPISIINTDNFLQQYLTINDSFHNKDFKIWMVVNDQIRLMQSGTVVNISLSDETAIFNVNDPTENLQQTCTFGDSIDEIYTNDTTYPNMLGKDLNKPICFIMAPISHYMTYVDDDTPVRFKAVYGNLARCTNYDYRLQSSKDAHDYNRTWVLGRVGANGLKAQSWPALTRQTQYGSSEVRYYYLPDHDFSIGETVKWQSTGTKYGLVRYDKSFIYSVDSLEYNLVIETADGSASVPPSTTAGFDAMDHAPILSWFDHDYVLSGTNYNQVLVSSDSFVHGLHFTYTETATDGGNKLITITLNSGTSSPEYHALGVESSLDDGTLRPQQDNIFYALKPADSLTHGEAIEKIISGSGLTVNSASITQADSDLVANVSYQVPKMKFGSAESISTINIDVGIIESDDFPTGLEAIEDILSSTNGHILLNASGEIEYKIISAPDDGSDPWTGETISGDDYNEKTHSINLSYRDLKTDITFKNPHIPVTTAIDRGASALESNDIIISDLTAKYLHGISKIETINHTLDYDSITNNAQNLFDIKSVRTARYSIKTPSKNLDSDLGDNFEFISDFALGGTGKTRLKIVTIEKSGENTSIEADDFKGLE